MRHFARILLITLALMLLGLMLTPKATPAQTSPCDSLPITRVPVNWYIRPLHPCAGDSVTLILMSCRPCVDLHDAFLQRGPGPDENRIIVDLSMSVVCPATTVCQPDSLLIPLGVVGLGTNQYLLDERVAVVAGADTCRIEREDSVRFSISCPPANGLPFVSTVRFGAPGMNGPVVCPNQLIPVHLDGYFPNGCYQFLSLVLTQESGVVGPPEITVHVAHRTCGVCTMDTPSWSADTVIAALPVGRYDVPIRVQDDGYCVDPTTFNHYEATRPLVVPTNCEVSVSDSLLPRITKVRIGESDTCATCLPVVCRDRKIPLHLEGLTGCPYSFGRLELLPDTDAVAPPIVVVHINNCVVCDCVPTPPHNPWSADTLLPALPPGPYALDIRTQIDPPVNVPPAPLRVAFLVADSCPVPPQPPQGPLPYTTVLRVGPPPVCNTCVPRICPNQPFPFLAAGVLPNTCYRFVGLRLLPSMIVGPRAEPPIVRLIVAKNDCMEWPCEGMTIPWAAEARLPGLPAGKYELPVQLAVVSMCDSTRFDSLYSTTIPFAVKDSCAGGPVETCLNADWEHGERLGGCDAHVGPNEPAKVTMTLHATVPLAGVQGRLRLYPSGLRITALEPVGLAAGMKIQWRSLADGGARFVMFAESGAPIAPVRCDSATRCLPGGVLAVTLEVPGNATRYPAVTHVTADSLLGSDSLGVAVPECPIMTLVAVEAEVCSGASSCDFNQDGHLDVRDLVSMVHCVLGQGACTDTVRLDCNADGHVRVDDVICCARQILRGGERDTSGGRSEPGVVVGLGDAAWGAGGLSVPVVLDGCDRVGAARLTLALPADRFDVTGIDLAGAAPHWLELHEVVDGQLVIGLIALESGAAPPELVMSLRLALKPGQTAGGDVTLADAQFSGADGVTLLAPQSGGPVPLAAPRALGLSAARPNPFTRTTQLTLSIERDADVEVSVHDLGGRRIATLFHGALAAGTAREFAWNGARDDGTVAANGIYFVHARVGADRMTRRVVYLRGR
jgi:hypothetical protein